MITTDFYSETPVLKGKDAERLLKAMGNVTPLPKKQVEEMRRNYQEFLYRRAAKRTNI